MQRPGGYIAVEGPIGVGKTSLSRLLARELNARLVLEEVEDNPFLERFYEDSEKYALPVQLYFLLTRYNQQRALAVGQASSLSTPTGATVADYLLAKDGIFAALNLDPDELSLYQNVQSLLDARSAKPDLVVYMSARVEVLAERLRKRNRDFERYISLDYLEQVSAAFRDFFFNYDETPLLVVETSDIDFVEDSDDLRDLFYEIKSAGRGVQHFVPRKR
jgi:deoxyadenosine/deoxycytidine kinase